jgi:hypothetical protein
MAPPFSTAAKVESLPHQPRPCVRENARHVVESDAATHNGHGQWRERRNSRDQRNKYSTFDRRRAEVRF